MKLVADLTGWKLAPVGPTPEMIDRGVAFALNVSISRDYRWTEYVSDLYGRMLSASPSAPDHIVDANKMVLPSRERIAKALFSKSVYHGYNAETLNAEWHRTRGLHLSAADAILALFIAPAKPR